MKQEEYRNSKFAPIVRCVRYNSIGNDFDWAGVLIVPRNDPTRFHVIGVNMWIGGKKEKKLKVKESTDWEQIKGSLHPRGFVGCISFDHLEILTKYN